MNSYIHFWLILTKRGDSKMNKSKKHSNCTPIECQETAAWADIKKTIPESKVPIPSQSAVVEAKEWVEDENQK
ncbi:protein of unknown function [Alkalithermobacter thermoalcaliphilus JW-YL-7 = DSM 7308]|uniref:DUF3787 domain-containing protein n=2 Tax=Clostridium paradoxum TaxID=29346 RepID=A0A150FQI3_CLOPD|nr:Protein of unknown function DUF3787 [[Clostridium] paradoxum JW-YL-7 = DSM 7308]SHK79652.1 protein of unknown function [[Clostridium] paradoxum JW-YL-7 = DSM 7308]